MFGHVDHRRQATRHEDRVVLTDVHVGQFLGLLHRGPTFSHQEGEVVRIAGQVERVEKRRVASQTGKVDLVSRTVEFRVRVCDFGQKVPCPPLVRTNDVSVRNDEQYRFRHDHSFVRSVAILVPTAGPNIFWEEPEPGSKPDRPSERWTYAASRTVTAPAAGSTATAAFTAPCFNAELVFSLIRAAR